MKALAFLFLSVLLAQVTAAKQDKFAEFHTLSQSSTPLKLDDAVYSELTSAPRNYSAAVLLTALEARFGCQLCRDAQPEWDLLARSWERGDRRGESRIIFGTLDFADGKNTFQKVRLLGFTLPNAHLY